MSAWACGTRTVSFTGTPAAAVTADTGTIAEEPSGDTAAVRHGSAQCETPDRPAPRRKIFFPQPVVRLPDTAGVVVQGAAQPSEVFRMTAADVCRDVVTSGLSPPGVPLTSSEPGDK
ncbi:hypothetical protein [Streptomyces sp. NPDC102462]|uniref:hypothetical protein n=1 Tax=Streptomyces sp. NPDC102462 TaxID=3366178 RepID=UPI0037F6BF9E